MADVIEGARHIMATISRDEVSSNSMESDIDKGVDTSLDEALHIAFINSRIHTVIISGSTGVGKSLLVRQWLANHHIEFRILPVYVQLSQLVSHIDLEQSLTQGRFIESKPILGVGPSCIVVDDIDRMAEDVRHHLLSQARTLGVLVIGTINYREGSLRDDEWELVDIHVSLQESTLEDRIRVLQIHRSHDDYHRICGIVGHRESSSISNIQDIDSQFIDDIVVPQAIMELVIAYAQRAGCAGHSSEWLLLEVAKTLALISNSTYCKPYHLERASLYVLPHRMRQQLDSMGNGKQADPNMNSNYSSDYNGRAMNSHRSDDTDNTLDGDDIEYVLEGDSVNGDPSERGKLSANMGISSRDELSVANGVPYSKDVDVIDGHGADKSDTNTSQDSNGCELPEQVATIGLELFRFIISSKYVDTHYRSCSGRRFLTKTRSQRGRCVRAVKDAHALEDLAIEATIRAAAPYQRIRKANGALPCAICIKPEDYRRKEREALSRGFYLFVVDASGSMAAKSRMEAAKGAVMSILKDAYVKRDAVAMIAFRKDTAEVILPFTSSVERAQGLLRSLPTGGRTPLGEGLRVAYELCCQTLRKEPYERIQVILITDGRATWGITDNPLEEAKQWARAIGTLPVDSIMLDTESGFIRLGGAKELCYLMQGHYYEMSSIDMNHVLHVVRR